MSAAHDVHGRRRGSAEVGANTQLDPTGRTNPEPIRLLVVDDHDLFRVGLASVLAGQDDIEVVAQASCGAMAVRLAAELRPTVVLMDLRLPDIDGPTAARSILEREPTARIVILTVAADESDIASAVDAGACGYVLKDSSVDDIVGAIRAAASGSAWLSPRAAQTVLDRMRRAYPAASLPAGPDDGLSRRETEVLRGLARGLDNHQIALELSISPRTAKNHVANILEKLGVSNRVQAAVYAVRRGIA
jgi:DNA-binding NarL/FixJ family response regulator